MGKKRAKMSHDQFDPEQLPPHFRQQLHEKTMTFLRDLFAPEPVPMYINPSTGEEVIAMEKVCDKLGLDFEAELQKMQSDQVLRHHLSQIDRRQAVRVIVPPGRQREVPEP
jgi:hypothetical protein